MKKYTWIKKLGKSLVPSDFYIHVLQEPMHKAFVYIFIFITILSTITGSYTGYQIKSQTDQFIADYEAGNFPAFTISKDGLWVDGNEPIILDYLEVPIIIDDKGDFDINDAALMDEAILLEKERITFILPGISPVLSNYSSIPSLMMLPNGTFDTRQHMYLFRAMSLTSIPICILILWIYSTIQFFYYSLVVLMIANLTRMILGLGIKVKQIYHMTIYAMTFSVFWTHFSTLLPGNVPLMLDAFASYVVPTIILFSVFIQIRRKAFEELKKRQKNKHKK